jgi:hypothetical protein
LWARCARGTAAGGLIDRPDSTAEAEAARRCIGGLPGTASSGSAAWRQFVDATRGGAAQRQVVDAAGG